MLKDFKAFLLKGNVIDLAVAFVIAEAFVAIVTAFVKDLLTPLLAIPGNHANFSALHFTVNHSQFDYGDVVNAVIAFIIIAAAIFFIVVYPLQRMAARRPQAATARPCPECLSDIPIAATRCAFCTSVVPPVATT